MKKLNLILGFSFLLSYSAFAQMMNIHLKNGNVIPVPLKDIDKITYDMERALDGKKAELISDPLLGDMTQAAVMAQQYYRKPASLGGGNNSFKGWNIPDNITDTSNGTITAKVEKEKITLTGVSKTSKKGDEPLKIMMIVVKDGIKETTIQ